ncbi:MAG TPA: hypothetical protein VGN34_33645 [Ktedonobacteraceae bacterium]|jgi:hypothetical protein
MATGTALWYQSPLPPLAIRWVLTRDPEGQFEPIGLLCTDQNADAVQILEWFLLRWNVEVTLLFTLFTIITSHPIFDVIVNDKV